MKFDKRIDFYALFAMWVLFFFIFQLITPNLTPHIRLMDTDLDILLEHDSGSNLRRQIVFILSFFVSFLAYKLRYKSLYTAFIAFGWFLPFVLLGFLSYFWSEYPFFSLKRIILQFIIISTFIFIVFSVSNPRLIWLNIQAISLILLFFILMLILYNKNIAFNAHGNLAGNFQSKNNMGIIASILCVLSYYIYTSANKINRNFIEKLAPFAAFAWFILLILSFSKTAIGLTVLFFLLVFLKINLKYICFLLFLMVIGIYILIPVSSVLVEFTTLQLYQYLWGDLSFTGRTGIWSKLIPVVVDKPWFGVGYAAFWGVGEVHEAIHTKWGYMKFLNSAHNGYLDIMLTMGMLGFSIMIFSLMALFLKISRGLDLITAFCIYFALLNNHLESSIYRDAHPIWMFLLLSLFISLRKIREYKSNT